MTLTQYQRRGVVLELESLLDDAALLVGGVVLPLLPALLVVDDTCEPDDAEDALDTDAEDLGDDVDELDDEEELEPEDSEEAFEDDDDDDEEDSELEDDDSSVEVELVSEEVLDSDE